MFWILALFNAAKTIALDLYLALLGNNRLPPGRVVPFERSMLVDQKFLLEQSRIYGPIFKTMWSGHLVVCIASNELGRKLLHQHETSLKSISVDITKFFPQGIIRNMQGVAHAQCRHQLTRVLKKEILKAAEQKLRNSAARHFQAYASLCSNRSPTGEEQRELLLNIALDWLLILFFGIDAADERFEELRVLYKKLGPEGITWNIASEHIKAFEAIQSVYAKLPLIKNSYLGEAKTLNFTDMSAIGNLLYMVEMGRHDITGLLHWLLKYLGDNQHSIQNSARSFSNTSPQKTQAFIKETLRLNQVAAILRKSTQSFEFEGFHVPSDSFLRICLWEAHKDPNHFEKPFEFTLSRFENNQTDVEKFAPFGMDRHRCLGDDIVIRLAELFLEELTSKFEIKTIADGHPVLQFTVWEPSPNFVMHFSERFRSFAP